MSLRLTKQQKARFARIIFNSPGHEKQEIDDLTEDELQKIRSMYAQKIAYEAVNGKIQNFFPGDQDTANHGPRIPNLLTSVCCCCYPSENRDYFDLTTAIFIKRFFYPFFFWKSGFFRINQGKGEQYGLIWLILTYTIILGLSASLNKYFIEPDNFSFDNQMMISALGLTVIFMIAQPLIYASVIGCLSGSIYTSQSMMLSSYSLVLYFVPTLFCIVPSLYWHIIMMSAGSIFRAIFLFRNYSTRIQSKLYILLFVIFIIEGIYLFISIRVMFMEDVGYGFVQGFNAIFGSNPKIQENTQTAKAASKKQHHQFYTFLRYFQN